MKYITLAFMLFIGLNLFSQKEKKPDEKVKVFYKDVAAETDDYKIYIEDAVAVGNQSKFKMRVFNKTNDYLLIKPSEITFTADGKTFTSKDRTFVIPPNDESHLVIDFKGSGMQFENYSLDVKGIYKASAGGKIIEIPNFELPATKKEFTAGNFLCTLKKGDSKTDKTVARFECAYNGDGVGVIQPYKSVAVMPNGTDNANSKKTKAQVLEKGVTEDFTLLFLEVKGAGDMQKKAIQIKWGETFRESKLVLLKSVAVNMQKDITTPQEKPQK